MIAYRRGEELVVGCLFERAAKSLAQRRVVAGRRECPPKLGEPAVPERLGGADDRGIAGAELFGQCGGGEQRRLGSEIEQQLGDSALRGRERPAAFVDALGIAIRSACY